MPRINGQILVYVVVGAVLLLVGLNSIRSGDSGAGEHTGAGSESFGADPGQAGESAGGGFEISAGSRRLVVDVSGAVRQPGVYRFEHGARVIDAIDRAGGPTGDAVVGLINRAATLSDGQQVVVPSSSAGSGGAAGVGAGGVAPGAPGAPVSLGTATREQLEEIDGIGPVTAEKILEFRDSQGGLGSIDELDQVSGIGPV
ncbi:MAG: helix-hairpin-helix domain-containing protein, partial [Solirubrobacterales bacterium]|nr:helix-hairpin-helix domain-containing protein [Solirubrobacterales bacterium]